MHTFCVAALTKIICTFVTGYNAIGPWLWTPLLIAVVSELLTLIEGGGKESRETNHNWEKSQSILHTKLRKHCIKTITPHHNRVTALFPGPPAWAGASRELLDFMVQGKINRGIHTDHPAGRHSIRINQCPPPPFRIFTGRMPFLPPNQQCQSTEGN